jgi:uncharacterized protein
MKVFADTSAFFALLDRDDLNHAKARKSWQVILDQEMSLITTNYILVECFALIQNRLGMDAVRAFQEDIAPLLVIEYVGPETHKSGASALLASGRRKLSMVDCVSFEVMRDLGIKTYFAFDPHFSEQGFTAIHN